MYTHLVRHDMPLCNRKRSFLLQQGKKHKQSSAGPSAGLSVWLQHATRRSADRSFCSNSTVIENCRPSPSADVPAHLFPQPQHFGARSPIGHHAAAAIAPSGIIPTTRVDHGFHRGVLSPQLASHPALDTPAAPAGGSMHSTRRPIHCCKVSEPLHSGTWRSELGRLVVCISTTGDPGVVRGEAKG